MEGSPAEVEARGGGVMMRLVEVMARWAMMVSERDWAAWREGKW